MANTTDITAPAIDPLYGQSPDQLTEHDRRQYQAFLSRRQGVVALASAQLREKQNAYRRNSASRARDLASFRRGIRKTAIIVVVAALVTAGVADLLSIFDLGFIVSWLIPIFCGLMVRRINSMKKNSESIARAALKQQQYLRVLRQRAGPALVATGNGALLADAGPGIRYQFKSYVGTFIRTQVVTQILELIPGLDAILPAYLYSVVRVILDQRKEYRAAAAILVPYEQLLATINRIELAETQALAQQISAFIQSSGPAPRQRRPRVQRPAPTPIPMSDVRLQYAA